MAVLRRGAHRRAGGIGRRAGRGAAGAGRAHGAPGDMARSRGPFRRALHDPSLVARAPLPADANARADMTARVPRTRETLAEVARLGLWEAPSWVDELLD